MSRKLVAFDTETGLIRPALLAPPMVCLTWQVLGEQAQIAHHSDTFELLSTWLSEYVIVGHNVAYDLAVVGARWPSLLPAIFRAYDEDRVTDTQIRQQLLDIASGRYGTQEYTLEALAKRCAGMTLQKDGWRLSYSAFIDTPLSAWPAKALEVQAAAKPRVAELAFAIDAARARKDDAAVKALTKERQGLVDMIESDPSRATEYPLDDARATLAVYLAQEKHVAFLDDQFRQCRGAFALHLSSAWGLRTDVDGVERLRAATQAAYDALEADMIWEGFIRNNKKRTRDTKAAKERMVEVCKEQGRSLPRTDGHTAASTKCVDAAGNKLPGGDDACVEHICLDATACESTFDPLLKAYAEVSTLKKVLSNDIESLKRGVIYPLHTRYGLAETGRTTSSKPPIQNLCKREGIRESFIARPGMAFVAADYPALEAYTWAQCCSTWLGQSELAKALNGGLDPHLAMAANILGTSYADAKARYDAGDQEVADVRQLAKVANFGFPGGMGAKTMLVSAVTQLKKEVVARLGLDLERMKRLRQEWEDTWPEAKLYFARVKSFGPKYPEEYTATVESLFTRRYRGDVTYCAASNNGFQGLGADCAKEALWRIARAQYTQPEHPLWNTRTVAFIHDEIIIEAPLARVHEAGNALADEMVAGANRYLKNVPIPRAKVKPVSMLRWSKKATPAFDVEGRLIPWDM